MDVAVLLVDAFAQLGIEARAHVGAPDHGIDLVLDPDGIAVPAEVKRRALVTDDVVSRLFAERSSSKSVLLVVGDRVTDNARKLLTSRGAGYYDLRGRLALRTDRLVIDAEIEPVTQRVSRSDALSGKAGLEVAAALLMQPARPTAVRELARELGRSASTVSEILSALRQHDLIDADNKVPDARLFWQLADRWPKTRTYLASLPAPPGANLTGALRLGLENIEHTVGWALTDSAAAAVYGAPLGFRSGQILDFYVPDEATLRRATTLLGAATTASQARATARVTPVPAIVRQRVDLQENPTEWPLARPLYVALDLAQDAGRGHEILDAWTPEAQWSRVW